MKPPSETIPKFIISLERDKERTAYLQKEVYPKLTNYLKCKAFDGEKDDVNACLSENNIFIADSFMEKCNVGQLGCYLSHFQLWKYLVEKKINLAIVLEDDVKIYKNFNKMIDSIYENLPVKFDFVHLFTHPDKQKMEYLEGKDGEIIPAEDNFGTVAYMISLRGAKKLIKLTSMLKIQAPVDRQINFYIEHKFINAYMVKKPFLITQGEIMPNRGVYNNSFRSNIWYTKRLNETNIVDPQFIRQPGFSDEDVNKLEEELEKQKMQEKIVENKVEEKEIPLQNESAEQKTVSETVDEPESPKVETIHINGLNEEQPENLQTTQDQPNNELQPKEEQPNVELQPKEEQPNVELQPKEEQPNVELQTTEELVLEEDEEDKIVTSIIGKLNEYREMVA